MQALIEAFDELGLRAYPAEGDCGADLILEGPAGRIIVVVKGISVGDAARVRGMTALQTGIPAGKQQLVTVVVADQLSDQARGDLRKGGFGYLDRRGAMWLRGQGVFINDTSLPGRARRREAAGQPIRGGVGVGVALYLLMYPDHGPVPVRTIASAVGASPSTVHDALRSLRDHALIRADRSPLIPDLFDALSDVWLPQRVAVSREPAPSDAQLGLGLHREEDPGHLADQGWALGGDVAAAALGAPIVVGSAAQPDFYVPTRALLSRAVHVLGSSDLEDRSATVAVAPSPLVTRMRRNPESMSAPWLIWPLAHPVVVALDLAQDQARGREILSDWEPGGALRVW
jgi:hypothetical protein